MIMAQSHWLGSLWGGALLLASACGPNTARENEMAGGNGAGNRSVISGVEDDTIRNVPDTGSPATMPANTGAPGSGGNSTQ